MNQYEFIPIVVIMLIPLVAIVGGIISGIVKSLGRQKLLELAQKERIAAIERGMDPSQLPPIPAIDEANGSLTDAGFQRQQLKRSQGLLIGGIITIAVAVGMMAMLTVVEPDEKAWAVGLIPGAIGAALLVSARIVHPGPTDKALGLGDKER